jgi:hypothetical protein
MWMFAAMIGLGGVIAVMVIKALDAGAPTEEDDAEVAPPPPAPRRGPRLRSPWLIAEATVDGEVRLRFAAKIGDPIVLPLEPLEAGRPTSWRRAVEIDGSGHVTVPGGEAAQERDRITWTDGRVALVLDGRASDPGVARVAPFAAPQWTPAPPADADEALRVEEEEDGLAEALRLDPSPPAVADLVDDAWLPLGSDGTGDGLIGVPDGRGNLVVYWVGHDPFGIWLVSPTLAGVLERAKDRDVDFLSGDGVAVHPMPACYLGGDEPELARLGATWMLDFRGVAPGSSHEEGALPVKAVGPYLLVCELV